jgi:signal transduction histidine kinase
LWLSLIPAAAVALLAAVVVGVLLSVDHSSTATGVVLAIAVAAVVLVLAGGAYGAEVATRWLHQRLGALRFSSARGEEDLWRVVDRVRTGERFAPHGLEVPPAEDADPLQLLAYDLRRSQLAAQNAVLQASVLMASAATSDQQVEVFVNLARRMQSLVHREIQLLDELEAKVEDPDLLKGLFTVDHLATRMRRQSESLAVLGGATSRRQWSRPVNMYEVLRSAVAEVEQYSRVKVVPPIEGTLDGSAVADAIHLVAELVENATKFSPPHTQVLLRAQNVTAGVAIEVEDRGLGMPPDDQERMNELLADPGRVNIGDLLYDGRIGLFVVSALARRHGIKVQLRSNIFGGIQAVIVVPRVLIDSGSQNAAAGRAAGTPVAAPADARPSLPAREPAGRPRAHGDPASNAPSAPEPARDRRAEDGERPPLPVRRVQGHLAPQLREARAVNRQDEPPADHTPGLMAAFQGGVSRAEEDDGSDLSGRTDSIS